jgi:hypothetical protein
MAAFLQGFGLVLRPSELHPFRWTSGIRILDLREDDHGEAN